MSSSFFYILYLFLSMLLFLWLLRKYFSLHQVAAISKEDLPEYLSKHKILFMDVRFARESDAHPVAHAFCCPLASVSSATLNFEPDQHILTFCNSGIRAYKAAQLLQKRGFKNVFCFAGAYHELSFATMQKDS